jgi:hypothetical protein
MTIPGERTQFSYYKYKNHLQIGKQQAAKKMHEYEQNTSHHICTFPTATTSSTTVSAIIIIAVASVVWRGETKSRNYISAVGKTQH